MSPVGQDSTVGIVSVHGLEGPVASQYSDCPWAGRPSGQIPVGGDIFCTHLDRPWGSSSLLYNGYQVSFPGLKQPGHGVILPPPSSAEVKEIVSCTSTPPLGLHGRL